MPKSALPPHLDTPEEWKGTDWDVWYQRWMLHIKHWFAFGPRATEWWACWREFPTTLLALKGDGPYRLESSDGNDEFGDGDDRYIGLLGWKPTYPYKNERVYLSAIQYWCKWHFQIQWPFFIAFHYYIDDVPKPPERAGDRRVLYFRFGARRDADRVYWFPSLFIGLSWN